MLSSGGLLRCSRSHHEYEEQHISEPRINDRIRVAEVRLVGPNGEQVGIVRVEDALRLAQEADLDLVEVAPDARPPVCKLMDYGKFKYEADMKAREARRNQANTVLKEIRFRLKIDPHDYGTKKGHVERFLKAGDKVKVMIMFRGREQSRPEMGVRLLQRLADDVVELGFIESMPKQDGRNMIMVLGPTKKKADAKAEQQQRRRERDAADAPAQEQVPAAAPARTAPAAEPTPAPAETEAVPAVEAASPAVGAATPVAATATPVAETATPAADTATPAAEKAAPAPRPAARPAAAAPARPAPAARAAAPAPRAAAPRASAEAAPAARPAATPQPAATPKPVAAPKPSAAAPKPAPAKPARPAPRPAARTKSTDDSSS
ncbi:translation initiation factor IF-3 [Actinotalea solisilvae]|uniref:translation initiation factor IF-3 n=1 Tax=Actinotalea solisilvae TaxID=2072922 RepID=UPI0035565561